MHPPTATFRRSAGPAAVPAPVPSKQQAKQQRKRKKLEQLKKGPVTVSVISAVNKMASGEREGCEFPQYFAYSSWAKPEKQGCYQAESSCVRS